MKTKMTKPSIGKLIQTREISKFDLEKKRQKQKAPKI